MHSEASCSGVASTLNDMLEAAHGSQNRIKNCAYLTTTTTTRTTITTTTRTTHLTSPSTVSPPVPLNYKCVASSAPSTQAAELVQQDFRYLVVDRDTVCRRHDEQGLLDITDNLLNDCGQDRGRNLNCDRMRAGLFQGNTPVRGALRDHIRSVVIKLGPTTLKMKTDVATCQCTGEMLNEEGGADCQSTYKGKRYCYVNPDQVACSDAQPVPLRLGQQKLALSYNACNLRDIKGGFLGAPKHRCEDIAAFLNTALLARREGTIVGCNPISSTPTTTPTSTTSTTMSTSPTATPTTSATSTATTSPTRTEAPSKCSTGQKLNADGKCGSCLFGTYQDAPVPHHRTSCNKCSFCDAGEFEFSRCNAGADTVCKTCQVCAEGSHMTHSCTAYQDTVCQKNAACEDRCKFDETTQTCWERNVQLPCMMHSKNTCPVGAPGETSRCQVVDGACVGGGQLFLATACNRMDYDVCHSAQGMAGCRWDVVGGACRSMECHDLSDATNCLNTYLDCAYDAAAAYCHPSSSPAPCFEYSSETACTDQGPRCTYDGKTARCSSSDSSSPLPCKEYSAGECPSRCISDTWAGGLCLEPQETTPCVLYNTVQRCETTVGGDIKEFYRKQATGTADTQCQAVTVCDPVLEYTATPPSTAADRVCAKVRICGPGTYEAALPTAVSDRQCAPVTTCNALSSSTPQYEVANSSASSDRVCRNIAPCSVGTSYETQAPSATSDRVCSALTACLSNEYESTPATATSDRKCADAACPPAHYRLSVDPAVPKHCTMWQACSLDSFEARAPSSTTDRVCTPTTECNQNEYELQTPTASADRACGSCTVCGEGFKQITACSVDSDAVCERCSCRPGSFLSDTCTDGLDNGVCAPCQSCALGYFRRAGCDDGVQDATCMRCSSCVPGEEYAARPCTETSDVQCEPITSCNQEHFLRDDSASAQGDETWISTEYEKVPPTPTSDRECAKYSPPCQPGEYEAAHYNNTHDRTCQSLMDCSTTTCPLRSWNVPFSAGWDANKWEWTMMEEGETCDSDSQTCVDFGSTPGYRVADFGTVDEYTRQYTGVDDYGNQNTYIIRVDDYQCACPSEQCSPGTIQMQEPGEDSDRMCAGCLSGGFQNKPGQQGTVSCLPFSTCVSGQEWEYAEPSASADRVCNAFTEPCDLTAGFYESSPPMDNKDRECTSVLECYGGQYQSVAANQTSDAVCTQVSTCPENTNVAEYYEKVGPTATSDRECRVATKCSTATHFECGALGAKNDRICCAVKQCARTEFMAKAHTATEDRVCQSHTVCGKGQFMATIGTPLTDRVCQAITKCSSLKPLAFELVAATVTTDTVCREATICAPGSYQVSAPGNGQDTKCKGCDGVKHFQDEAGQMKCKAVTACKKGVAYFQALPTPESDGQCTPLTQCQADEFISSPPQTTEDQVCTQCTVCGDGSYTKKRCTKTSDTMCHPWSECSEGTYQAAPPSEAADRMCKPHTRCTSNEFMVNPSNTTLRTDTTCQPYTECAPGTRQVEPGTPTSDRACEPCVAGQSYTAQSNRLSCTLCRNSCFVGYGVDSNCTQQQDTTCSVCPVGSFGTDGITCSPWTPVCPAGTFELHGPNTISDRLCAPCPDGSYRSIETGLPSCIPWTRCGREWVGAGGSATADQVCQPVSTALPTTPLPTTSATSSIVQATMGAVADDAAASIDLVLWCVIGVVVLICVLMVACRRRNHSGNVDLRHTVDGEFTVATTALSRQTPVHQDAMAIAAWENRQLGNIGRPGAFGVALEEMSKNYVDFDRAASPGAESTQSTASQSTNVNDCQGTQF